ncbi:hypothetical protein B0H34DRAFT_678200 [Crassisporium funariophilum]|nr:hypothetical protein B0H34DRAFT_678200 [Crassisporium funariophilum]
MAGLVDFLSLLTAIVVFGGAIYGVIYVVNLINQGVATTKETLKTKGLDISKSGVSVKTSRRLDRDDYVDATQRGVMRAMGAASFRKADGSANASAVPPEMDRATSSSSIKSTGSDGKKKKGLFGSRK